MVRYQGGVREKINKTSRECMRKTDIRPNKKVCVVPVTSEKKLG